MSGLFHVFVQGLNITDSALSANYRSAPVRDIFQAYEDRFGSGSVGVQLAGRESDLWFRIRLQPCGFVILSHHRSCPPGTTDWLIQSDYLQELIANSPHYLNHPEQLDWSWLRSAPGKPPAACEPRVTPRAAP